MSWTESNYPPDWDERRARILDRANNSCEFCGAVNDEIQIRGRKKIKVKGRSQSRVEPYPTIEAAIADGCQEAYPVKINISIMHLDHDETNWNVTDDRLKAACQLHHIRYDAPEKVKRTIQKAITLSAASFKRLQLAREENAPARPI